MSGNDTAVGGKTHVRGPDGNTYTFPPGVPLEEMRAAMIRVFGPPHLAQSQAGARIEVEGPDGAINEFPGNTTDEVIIRTMRRVYGEPRKEQLQAKIPEVERAGFTDQMLQSATFNTLDEITGAVSAPFSAAKRAVTGGDEGKGFGERLGDAYNRNRDWQRDRMELYRLENPNAAMAGDIAGGLLAAGPAAAARGATTAGPIARGAGAGALYGGAASAGDAEGFENRLAAIPGGAAFGAAAGGAIPIAGAAVGRVARPVRDAIQGRAAPHQYAAQKVAERLDDANLTPYAAANRIQRARDTTGQSLSLADVGGDSMRDLLRATTNIPGPARNRVATRLSTRAMAQGDRIKRIVGEVFKDPAGYGKAVDDVLEERLTAAGPYYKRAYENPVEHNEVLDELLSRPAGKRALAYAREIAENEGVPFQNWYGAIDDAGNVTNRKRVPDMRAWDYIKRALDGMIAEDAAKASPFGAKVNSAWGRSVKTIREGMLNELDRLNPDYSQARAVASDRFQAQEALEFGKDAFKLTPEQVTRRMKGYTPAQQELAQAGFAEAIRDKVDSAGITHNALNRFFNNRNQAAITKAMFGDNTTVYATFRRAMLNEARMRKTFDTVRGNSTTARQAAELMDAGGLREMAGVGADLVGGRGLSALAQFVKSRMARLGGFTPQVADDVAKILMERDPAVVRQLASQLHQITQSARSRAGARAAFSQAISAATGIQADELK